MEASSSSPAGDGGKDGLDLGHNRRISQLFWPEHCVNLGTIQQKRGAGHEAY